MCSSTSSRPTRCAQAQANPDEYRSLVVRVAGYSAYFIELDKELQDEIIRRTEFETRMTAVQSWRRVRGIVFDVQRMSLHDGPGMRTNVFLKGCPLRCGWCANPESQQPQPQLTLHAANCIDCGQFAEPCTVCALAAASARGGS